MSRATTTWTAILLVASMIASFFVLQHKEAAYPSTSMEDVLFMPSPQVVKRASIGYSGLLADIYWMRVVQYFGSKHKRGSMEYKALAPLLEIAITLDPHLVIAYEWGATFLDQPPPSGAGDDQAAVALIRKGIANNPNNWHLYVTLGFIQYESEHNYLAAAKTFEEGSKVPNANPSLKVMAAKMLTDAGSLDTALYLWGTIYEQATDKSLKQNALQHFESLKVDQQVSELQALVDRFRQNAGHNPQSWSELVSARLLRATPLDPQGFPYVLSGGKVSVADPKNFPFRNEGKR